MTDYFTPEQIEQLRAFKTPTPPARKTRRKGTLRVARLLNVLADPEKPVMVTTWDVESRLRDLGLIADLWPSVTTPDGMAKTLGDLLGAHGLKLASTNGKKGELKQYMIPPGGITEAYCVREGVELVDETAGPRRVPSDPKINPYATITAMFSREPASQEEVAS